MRQPLDHDAPALLLAQLVVVDLKGHDESRRGVVQLGSLGRPPDDSPSSRAKLTGSTIGSARAVERDTTHVLALQQLETVLPGQILEDQSLIALHVSRVGLSSPFWLEAKVTFPPAVRRPAEYGQPHGAIGTLHSTRVPDGLRAVIETEPDSARARSAIFRKPVAGAFAPWGADPVVRDRDEKHVVLRGDHHFD